jgi:hypothetical protein
MIDKGRRCAHFFVVNSRHNPTFRSQDPDNHGVLLAEHIQWAEKHNALQEVAAGLPSLREDEWHHLGEQTDNVRHRSSYVVGAS